MAGATATRGWATRRWLSGWAARACPAPACRVARVPCLARRFVLSVGAAGCTRVVCLVRRGPCVRVRPPPPQGGCCEGLHPPPRVIVVKDCCVFRAVEGVHETGFVNERERERS